MDQNDNEECISEFPETYASGLYGPLQSIPRVGEEYQIEIPSVITDSDYLGYIKNPIVEEETDGVLPSSFIIGLDIPIVWIYHEPQNMKNDNVVSLVPGYALESWNELERDSFLLGLYIFEKDFARLKRFMESKGTGDISSYYYGTFYRSDDYRRWSECRKRRGKRLLGKSIFSGLRQQEFIARLVPHVTEECYNSLMEVSRKFGDQKIELDKYVFTIKTLIGINMFIDTIAIGKGKQDLTGNGIEPTKQNQAIHIRPEIPIGKACSTLTKAEIIEFLTGDYRLSKARSGDLFWEAVWPRLLARGWHSEEPDGHSYAANKKQSLVFLMPGVTKFSRSLMKGDSYFDSITDVLNKVASAPQLIKLDNEENSEKVTNFTVKEEEKENMPLEKHKSHCYLQPRAQKYGKRVIVKFTVVDTSLIGGKIVRVRELETMNWDSDEIHIELLSGDGSDSEYLLLEDEEKLVKKLKTKHLEANVSDYIPPDATKVRKSKQENLGPQAKKRRRLSACSRDDSKTGSDLDSHVGSSSQANHKLSSNLSFTSRCSSIDTVEEQRLNLIDLNLPVPPEFGNGEFVAEVNDERKEPRPKKPKEEENGDSGSRRQSTRNRPPTVKALEAIANGFFTVNSRKKDKEDNFRDSLSVKRSKKVQVSRGEVWPVSECSTGDASSGVKGDDEDGEIEK